MNLRGFPSVRARREELEKKLSVSLKHIGTYSLNESQASTKNCENMVGVAQVPLGIAGPLVVKGISGKKRHYYLPLATTEGALVASINRGCKAIASNGATVLVERIGVTRGPVFKVKDSAELIKLTGFLRHYVETFKKIAASTSSHLHLIKYTTASVGQYLFVRFYFDTGDAMGMNMATIATQAIVERIEKETGIPCLTVAGNYDIDKKPAFLNSVGLRGWVVRGEVIIPPAVVRDVLKTTAEKIYEVWLAKCMVGAALSGSLGFNAQYANVVAALFIATGQDPAHVVEGSLGITTVESRKEGLYVSVHMPALMAGTVGGGTALSTQQEALSLMGVAGTGKARPLTPERSDGGRVAEFASVVGGAVLAGEVSLLASLAEGSLARAHKRFARSSLNH